MLRQQQCFFQETRQHLSTFHPFTFSPFHLFTLPHFFTFLPFHFFTLSPFHFFTFPFKTITFVCELIPQETNNVTKS